MKSPIVTSTYLLIFEKADDRCCAQSEFEPWAKDWMAQTDPLDRGSPKVH